MTRLVLSIALGIVLGNVLWEFALMAARWAGQSTVRAVAFVLRQVFEAPRIERRLEHE